MTLFSMTGFGRAEESLAQGRLVVEVRTLNLRGREINVYGNGMEIPEASCRELATKSFSRGRVDISLRMEGDTGSAESSEVRFLEDLKERIAHRDILLQEALLARLILTLQGPKGSFGLIRLPEETVVLAVGLAVARALEYRRSEGVLLQESILGLLGEMEGLLSHVALRVPVQEEAFAERIKKRLPDCDALEPQVAREIAQLAERLDITEEIERLKAHFSRMNELLETSRPVGRELDFICQELIRETNTIGSKSQDREISRLVISLKTVCEKVRELAANVE